MIMNVIKEQETVCIEYLLMIVVVTRDIRMAVVVTN